MKAKTTPNDSVGLGQIILTLSPAVIVLLFYSMRFSALLGAFLFTALVFSSPDSYRTRGGSLVPAISLVALLLLSAAVVFVLS